MKTKQSKNLRNVASSRVMYYLLVLLALPSYLQGYELVDDDGFRHSFSSPFRRIISLYPAHTENLVELGAGDSLIGISTSDGEIASLNTVPRFSYHDSVEKFITAAPDCILIRPMIRHSAANLIEKLLQYGITIVSLQPTSSKELFTYWKKLGIISGKEHNAEKMVSSFRTTLSKMTNAIAHIPHENRTRVYFESIHKRMKTFSPSSIAMFCLESAGGINIANDAIPRRNTNIAAYSKEKILSHAEKIDVFLAQNGRMNPVTIDIIKNEPGFGAIKAINNNRIFLIDESIVSRPTPKLLIGIKTIQTFLYPSIPSTI